MNNSTGLDLDLLARVLAIKQEEKMNGICRPVKLAPSIWYTIEAKSEPKVKKSK